MLMKVAAMTLNEWEPAFSTLVYHLTIDSHVASLIVFFESIILSEWYSCLDSRLQALSSGPAQASNPSPMRGSGGHTGHSPTKQDAPRIICKNNYLF